MLTKAIIQNIDYTKNLCRVRIPLLENASRNVNMIEADAQFSTVPGIYNSYKTGDIVFIGFEENKLELPVVLGKLFVSVAAEASSYRGNLSGNSLSITDTAQLPYSTLFDFTKISQNDQLYNNLNTPKKLADSIITLQQAQTQKYQTVIRVYIDTDSIYDLYLKTSTDFTYSAGGSNEPLYRLCTALKNSQSTDTFIPLEWAISEKNYQIHPAAMQIQEFASNNLKIKLAIGGISYDVGETNIQSIKSSAIYY